MWGLILDMTLHLQDCIMAEIREVMLLILIHYGHSYLMHKISNNVLIIFKRCYFVYSSLLLQNMQLLLMYNLHSCTTISLIVIPSENLEVILLFTACYDGCVTYQIINQLSSAYMLLYVSFTVVSEYAIVIRV